jgi:hypothetical protein
MPWDIGADQISRTYGVLTLVGGESRYLYDIASRPGQEFSFSLGSALRLKNDLRLNDGKTLLLGTTGTAASLSVTAGDVTLQAAGGRVTLLSDEIDLNGVLFLVGRLEVGETKFDISQITNLLATNIVIPATYAPPVGWDIGADQFYRPVPVARAQDGSLIASNEIGASNRSWHITSAGVAKFSGASFSGLTLAIVTKAFADTGYIATVADYTIQGDAVGGAVVLNLPTAVGISGRIHNFVKIDATANAVTVTPNGAETISGAASKILAAQWATVTIQSNGTNWIIL